MSLSVKQYALIFGLIIIVLFSVFTYKVNTNLTKTRQAIDTSQKSAAYHELSKAIDLTMDMVRSSATKLSQWQEIKQQLDNPEIFTYWYNIRLEHALYDLKQYTVDLMIYDRDGKALAIRENDILPQRININDTYRFHFIISSDSDITYMIPIYSEENEDQIKGYLSARLEFINLLKSHSQFIHIDLDTLVLKPNNSAENFQTLTFDDFTFNQHKEEGIQILEAQLRQSMIELVLIVVIPTIILYIAFAFIIGIPLNAINNYINNLRKNPELVNHNNKFQIKELNSVFESLNELHNELSQNEKHLSLTLNSIGDAVITTDSKTGIVRMNPVAEKLTGWPFNDAKGKPVNHVFNIINALNRDKIDKPFDEVIKAGNIIHISKDTILISRDNIEYHIADSAAPIRDDNGDICGMVLVFNDITSQKLKDEQLQHSLKMDALGKLTGGIAHDFNNLLSIILGYSELLITQLASQPKQLEYTQQIYNAGERARKLTSKLLAFSRKKIPTASVTDINRQILDMRHMLESTLTPRVALKIELEEDLWPVYLDQDQLQDSILNICINAMHAMPEGGSLTVSTRKTHISDNDRIHFDLKTGDYVLLSLTDTGIGMNYEVRQKIFDPFFTTKGENGTGLGMSQVYGFVQQSGGAVHVYSEPGHGTRISIYLPRCQEARHQTEQQPISEPQSPAITRNSKSILIVDDEPSLLKLSCQILNDQGYHTLGADNARDALQILENHTVDLLITDVIMPDTDGYQLAKMVARQYPHIKIQMVSGFSDDRSKNSHDEQLHKEQLHKPFTSEELIKRVGEILID